MQECSGSQQEVWCALTQQPAKPDHGEHADPANGDGQERCIAPSAVRAVTIDTGELKQCQGYKPADKCREKPGVPVMHVQPCDGIDQKRSWQSVPEDAAPFEQEGSFLSLITKCRQEPQSGKKGQRATAPDQAVRDGEACDGAENEFQCHGVEGQGNPIHREGG